MLILAQLLTHYKFATLYRMTILIVKKNRKVGKQDLDDPLMYTTIILIRLFADLPLLLKRTYFAQLRRGVYFAKKLLVVI